MGTLVIYLVKLYRLVISPVLPRCCRYYPSCSLYMIRAVEMNGVLFGTLQGVGRILRCNPLYPGGVDFPKNIRRKVWRWSREHY